VNQQQQKEMSSLWNLIPGLGSSATATLTGNAQSGFTNFMAKPVAGGSQIQFQVPPTQGSQQVQVLKGTSPTGPWSPVTSSPYSFTNTTGADTITFTDTDNIIPGQKYYYALDVLQPNGIRSQTTPLTVVPLPTTGSGFHSVPAVPAVPAVPSSIASVAAPYTSTVGRFLAAPTAPAAIPVTATNILSKTTSNLPKQQYIVPGQSTVVARPAGAQGTFVVTPVPVGMLSVWVERATSASGPWSRITNAPWTFSGTTVPNTVQWTDANLTPNTKYFYSLGVIYPDNTQERIPIGSIVALASAGGPGPLIEKSGNNNGGWLSTGAIIGIVVAVILAIIGLVALAVRSRQQYSNQRARSIFNTRNLEY
jgi:hypothetical protein